MKKVVREKLERGKMDRDKIEIVGIDSLVPEEHLLRKIDLAVDFNRLYEIVEPLYCEDNGRPSIDPVVLFKMALIQHLYSLPSLRRTAEEVAEAGYLSPKVVFIDGTHSKDCVKTVQRHIWKDYEELADDVRYTPKYQKRYKRRKETIERVFADAKEKHAMRYTQYRGLAQVTKWVRLKFATMNLKKLAKWKWNARFSPLFSFLILNIYTRNPAAASCAAGFLDRLSPGIK